MKRVLTAFRLPLAVLPALVPAVAFAQAAAQRRFTFDRVVSILYGLAEFLIQAGMVLAFIMILYYAILIMTGGGIQSVGSGQNITKVNQAKKGLWYAIIGFAITIGVQVIVATVKNVVDSLK